MSGNGQMGGGLGEAGNGLIPTSGGFSGGQYNNPLAGQYTNAPSGLTGLNNQQQAMGPPVKPLGSPTGGGNVGLPVLNPGGNGMGMPANAGSQLGGGIPLGNAIQQNAIASKVPGASYNPLQQLPNQAPQPAPQLLPQPGQGALTPISRRLAGR